jgi:serine/threonine protein kinase
MKETRRKSNTRAKRSTHLFGDKDFESVYRRVLGKHGYKFTQVIGRGGMSRVDEVRHLATGELRAIKHLGPNPPPDKVEKFKKNLRRETEYNFDHPNVMKGVDYFEDEGNVFYVMPRMQHNLEHLLTDDRKYNITFLLDIIIQTTAGLNYLHQNGIIHRDLKPSNILYNIERDTIWVVICDFGLSQDKMAKFKTDLSRLFGGGRRGGTPSYAAPEQLRKDDKYDKKCDIYSLGRVMDELISNKANLHRKYIQTFHQNRKMDTMSKKVFLYKADKPYLLQGNTSKYLPYSLIHLILRCLQRNPARRPSDIVQVFYELTKIQQECRVADAGEMLRHEVLAYRMRAN